MTAQDASVVGNKEFQHTFRLVHSKCLTISTIEGFTAFEFHTLLLQLVFRRAHTGSFGGSKDGSWHDVNFDYCFDAIVYSVVVSLGFAAVENIFYVFDYGAHVALIRAVTAIPGHAIFGIFMGHYYGQAKMQEKIETYYKMIGMPANTGNRESSKSLLKKSLFIPVMLHGFYDFTASQNEPVMTIVFYIFIIIMDVVAVKRINRYSREDRPI